MHPDLRDLVDRIRYRRNPSPPGGEFVDGSLILQMELIESGAHYSEDDLFRALDLLGVPEEEQASWFERYASWL